MDFKLMFFGFYNMNIDRIVISAVVFLMMIALIYLILLMVGSYGRINKLHVKRTKYVIKLFSLFIIICYFIFLLVLWGINSQGILVLASTIFTVLGIALFATWSVLSNIVSSIIIFFGCPYRIGDYVKIVDGDNTLEGKITDINFYNVILEDINANVITFPNNIILQKAVIKNSTQ
ncbi:MAG TPA: mechanosensitive ion channel domain-containing protein [Thermodesulfobacteriota bacterium]|nr:mechanosensitive ion channel domain-containing protein [Thermodesulfobacteriota bacterium]